MRLLYVSLCIFDRQNSNLPKRRQNVPEIPGINYQLTSLQCYSSMLILWGQVNLYFYCSYFITIINKSHICLLSTHKMFKRPALKIVLRGQVYHMSYMLLNIVIIKWCLCLLNIYWCILLYAMCCFKHTANIKSSNPAAAWRVGCLLCPFYCRVYSGTEWLSNLPKIHSSELLTSYLPFTQELYK